MTELELVLSWREQAARYERDGVTIAARVLDRCAQELESAIANAGQEAVSLNDGARLSGYSADHLSRLIRDGRIPNVGTKRRPRIRVADLPRKAALTSPRRLSIVGAQ